MTATDYGWKVSMRDAEVAETEVLLDGPKRFVRETLIMPAGEKLDWYYVDTPASVLVVPVLEAGQFVMVQQYRYNLHRYTREFPAGEAGDGETMADAARRELLEETGYEPAEGAALKPLGAFYSLPSETNKVTHVFLVQPVVYAGTAAKDSQIEKYFNMSVQITAPGLALAEIGKSVAGTETITALLLARQAMSALS